MKLDIDHVQTVAAERATRWHGGSIKQWSILEWAGAMTGEAGEAANVAKKILSAELKLVGHAAPEFSELDMQVLRDKLAQECADTFLYLVLLAERGGINLAEAIVKTFNTKSRHSTPSQNSSGFVNVSS